jgi:phosphatidate cytidylyltransferase
VALVAVAVVAASAECYAALRRSGHHPATLVGLVGAGAMVVGTYLRGTEAIGLIWVLVIGTTFLWYLIGVARNRPATSIASTLLGFAWVGFLGSFAGLLLDPHAFPDRHGIAYLIGALAVTVGYDVGAYGVGSAIGRHALAPSISPNKTIEGLIGGMVVAAAVAIAVVSHIHPWTMHRAIALAVVAVIVAPLGDLAESMLKRDLGLKDMSSVLPGHGGLLDRIDAILFVLPAVYYLLQYLHAN